MSAYLIYHNGHTRMIMPKNGAHFKLEELYELIGCEYVDIVTLSDGRLMVCDEDGLFKKLPQNKVATNLYKKGRMSLEEMMALIETQMIINGHKDVKVMGIGGDDNVLGNVIVCDKSMIK